jgi:hypothetical protein
VSERIEIITHTTKAGYQLKKGTRIYYTGDCANIPDFGTITEMYQDKWGRFITVKLDDGREFKRIYLNAFEPSPGCRMIPEQEYREDRERKLAALQKRMEEIHNAQTNPSVH